MQNVPTAKLSKTSEALGGFEQPISWLQDRRINCYATEPGNREVSSSTLPDKVMVKKTKRASDDKVYAECTESKIFKYNGGHQTDSNHRSPAYKTRGITTILESRMKERKQK